MDNVPRDKTAVDVDVVKEALDNKANITLVDVRTPEEYAEGHIGESVLVPLQELQEQLEKIPDKTKTIYVYCRRGVRGVQAVEVLKNLGYTDVRNMLGGIEAWMLKNYSIQK